MFRLSQQAEAQTVIMSKRASASCLSLPRIQVKKAGVTNKQGRIKERAELPCLNKLFLLVC
jgi:hypothetical protein